MIKISNINCDELTQISDRGNFYETGNGEPGSQLMLIRLMERIEMRLTRQDRSDRDTTSKTNFPSVGCQKWIERCHTRPSWTLKSDKRERERERGRRRHLYWLLWKQLTRVRQLIVLSFLHHPRDDILPFLYTRNSIRFRSTASSAEKIIQMEYMDGTRPCHVLCDG